MHPPQRVSRRSPGAPPPQAPRFEPHRGSAPELLDEAPPLVLELLGAAPPLVGPVGEVDVVVHQLGHLRRQPARPQRGGGGALGMGGGEGRGRGAGACAGRAAAGGAASGRRGPGGRVAGAGRRRSAGALLVAEGKDDLHHVPLLLELLLRRLLQLLLRLQLALQLGDVQQPGCVAPGQLPALLLLVRQLLLEQVPPLLPLGQRPVALVQYALRRVQLLREAAVLLLRVRQLLGERLAALALLCATGWRVDLLGAICVGRDVGLRRGIQA